MKALLACLLRHVSRNVRKTVYDRGIALLIAFIVRRLYLAHDQKLIINTGWRTVHHLEYQGRVWLARLHLNGCIVIGAKSTSMVLDKLCDLLLDLFIYNMSISLALIMQGLPAKLITISMLRMNPNKISILL